MDHLTFLKRELAKMKRLGGYAYWQVQLFEEAVEREERKAATKQEQS